MLCYAALTLRCCAAQGWICNSSICMKRRGLKPTGIAIYDAHQRGFKSVAHLLQARMPAGLRSSCLRRCTALTVFYPN